MDYQVLDKRQGLTLLAGHLAYVMLRQTASRLDKPRVIASNNNSNNDDEMNINDNMSVRELPVQSVGSLSNNGDSRSNGNGARRLAAARDKVQGLSR